MTITINTPPDDASTMILFLEMGVGKAEEHLGELALPDVVGQVLHGVRSHHRRVLVLSWVFLAQVLDAQVNVLRHLHADLQAENELVRKDGAKCHCI